MSSDTTPAGAYPGETLTVTLPPMDFTAEAARAGRVMQAAEQAAQLTPEDFARWMELGEAIRAGTGQGNREAPHAALGEAIA